MSSKNLRKANSSSSFRVETIGKAPQNVGLRAPTFDAQGNLYVCFSLRGTIAKVTSGSQEEETKGDDKDRNVQFEEVANTGGQPMSISFIEGSEGESGDSPAQQQQSPEQILVADIAHGSILSIGPGSQPRASTGESSNREYTASSRPSAADDDAPQLIVQEYEGKPFWGPNHLSYDRAGNMYFTDSGPFGETTLQQPNGSLYCITTQQILRPILYECLAHPSAVIVGSSDNEIFMAELLSNRILRLVQRPSGVFHCSVFHQFSGKLGPATLAYNQSNRHLIIARFDFAECSNNAIISILDGQEGSLLNEWSIPGSELTGLAFRYGNL